MKTPEKGEVRKPTKTMSGVTPVAVMVKPRACPHGQCRYCPNLDVPQSYTPLSPPVIRAKILKYKAYEQVKSRLKAFNLMNHPTDKIEMIIMGGTFLSYPVKYQKEFVKGCYDALNGKKSASLEAAKKLNEKSRHRCIALCIETRPDYCSDKDIKRMLEFGATRVELGVQAIDDKIYEKVNRGHKVQDVVDTTKRLRNAGFKIGYHLMPGLPGSNLKKDLAMFKKIFSEGDFKPDQIKIYPCQVIRGSHLEKDFFEGKFKPYTLKQTEKLLLDIFKIIPEYCRVMRVMRELPPEFIVAGTTRISLRKDVTEKLIKEKSKIKEIRFREVGFAQQYMKYIDTKIKLKKTEYDSADGKEIFIEAVNKDNILFGLLRLRFPNQEDVKIKELKDSGIIRELHVYGKAVQIGKKGQDKLEQHRGIGKELMNYAEDYVKEKTKLKNVAVISGVGVRDYYRKLGYRLRGSYMKKKLI